MKSHIVHKRSPNGIGRLTYLALARLVSILNAEAKLFAWRANACLTRSKQARTRAEEHRFPACFRRMARCLSGSGWGLGDEEKYAKGSQRVLKTTRRAHCTQDAAKKN